MHPALRLIVNILVQNRPAPDGRLELCGEDNAAVHAVLQPLPDKITSAIAEQAARCLIDQPDNPVRIEHDQRIIHGIDDLACGKGRGDLLESIARY